MDRTKVCAAVVAALLASACSHPRRVTVGSKNFTEQLILGEILAQQIERKLDQPVTRKLDLGGTLLTHEAMLKGDIDLYPEYTGTALTAVLKQPPASDAGAVLATVRKGYAPSKLEWLDPLGFNNTFAMVVRRDDASARGVKSLTEAAAYDRGWRLGVGYEFVQRPDGLVGLLHTYPLKTKGSVKTMDLGLLYQALEQGQVDMVAGNATDGMLSAKPIVALEDDKHYFPPYQAAVVVRSAALQQYPGLRQALAELSGKISSDAMRKLNHEVDGKHTPVRDVAKNFLATVTP